MWLIYCTHTVYALSALKVFESSLDNEAPRNLTLVWVAKNR